MNYRETQDRQTYYLLINSPHVTADVASDIITLYLKDNLDKEVLHKSIDAMSKLQELRDKFLDKLKSELVSNPNIDFVFQTLYFCKRIRYNHDITRSLFNPDKPNVYPDFDTIMRLRLFVTDSIRIDDVTHNLTFGSIFTGLENGPVNMKEKIEKPIMQDKLKIVDCCTSEEGWCISAEDYRKPAKPDYQI